MNIHMHFHIHSFSFIIFLTAFNKCLDRKKKKRKAKTYHSCYILGHCYRKNFAGSVKLFFTLSKEW